MLSGPYMEKGFLAKCPKPSSVMGLKWGGSYSSGVSSWYVSFMNRYLCSISCILSHTHTKRLMNAQSQLVTCMCSGGIATLSAIYASDIVFLRLKLESQAVLHTSAGMLSKVLQMCTSILIRRHTWYLTELTLAFCKETHFAVITLLKDLQPALGTPSKVPETDCMQKQPQSSFLYLFLRAAPDYGMRGLALEYVCTHMITECSSKGAVLVREAVSTTQTCCMFLKLGMWTWNCVVQKAG